MCGNRGFTPVNKRKNFIGFCPVNGNTVFGRSWRIIRTVLSNEGRKWRFFNDQISEEKPKIDRTWLKFAALESWFRYFAILVRPILKAIYCIEIRLCYWELLKYEKNLPKRLHGDFEEQIFLSNWADRNKKPARLRHFESVHEQKSEKHCAHATYFSEQNERRNQSFLLIRPAKLLWNVC